MLDVLPGINHRSARLGLGHAQNDDLGEDADNP